MFCFSVMVTDGNAASTARLLKELKIEDEDPKTQLEKLRKVPSVELNNAVEKLIKVSINKVLMMLTSYITGVCPLPSSEKRWKVLTRDSRSSDEDG